jgi:hypothetical protein
MRNADAFFVFSSEAAKRAENIAYRKYCTSRVNVEIKMCGKAILLNIAVPN